MQLRKQARRRKRCEFQGNFRKILYHMNLRGIRKEEVAVWLQISVSTLYNRLSHPEKFTLAEINTIEKKLKLKPEEIINGET